VTVKREREREQIGSKMIVFDVNNVG